jgi:hypothetical protein
MFGCGASIEQEVSPSQDEQRPHYEQCQSLTGGPLTADCEGLGCAQDEQASHFLGLFLDVLKQHGVSDHHEVLSATMVGGYVEIDYVVSIDWFRGANAWLIPVADDAAFVTYLEQQACLTLPDVASFDLVAEQARVCDPSLPAGLCCVGPSANNGCRPICLNSFAEPDAGGCARVTVVSVDVERASILECSVGQQACP